jgi:hypothetical protein
VAAKDLLLLEAGSIGLFHRWAETGLVEGAPVERGWIRRSGRWVHIDTIDESEIPTSLGLLNDGHPEPTALLGQLPGATVLALELQHRGGTAVIAGEHASTQQYRARTVALNPPLYRLRSSDVMGMRADFLSLEVFARVPGAREEWEYTEDQRVQGYQLRLEQDTEDRSARLRRGLTLAVTSTWSVTGPLVDRRVTIPTSLIVRSSRPRKVFEVLRPLVDVQNLLSFLHHGFMPVHSAALTLDLNIDEAHPNLSNDVTCWCGWLFERPAGVAETSSPHPLLSLNDLGGVSALARWVNLAEDHPRAVGPVIAPFRYGAAVAESDLLTLGAAFEYWVAVHRHKRVRWATLPRPRRVTAHRWIMEAASRRAGKPFNAWVVDRAAWCDDFSASYEKLKHDPSCVISAELLIDLVISGRYLLFGLLADRIASSRRPTRKLFEAYTLSGLHSRLEARYSP